MLALALITIGALTGAPVEVDVPPNDGWVTDLADLLPRTEEQALEALMESYKQGSGQEVAVLTVPDLGGESIERYALEVGRAWGVGADDHAGALFVVARDDRKMRIEVGRGLEGRLTDSICGRIIRDVVKPSFKRDDYATGIRDGVLAIHAAAEGDYGPIEKRSGSKGKAVAGIVQLLIFILFIVLARRHRGGRGGRGGGGDVLPWLVMGSMMSGRHGRGGGFSSGGFGGGGGGFSGFGGGGGFSGGGASGSW